ncbi:MAG: DNA repair protein RadC [Candidatus Saccharimonadales bacterium]
MRIKDTDKKDRPREKLKAKGAVALSDFELLQALIGSGNKQTDVSTIARATQKLLQKHGADITYEQLEQITGLGSAKITEILAAFELSKRYLTESEQPVLDSAEKVVKELKDIRDKKQEYFICLTLDGANRLIAKRTISIGTLTASLVHPREVFADAITDRAASIIVAHNHPSGTLRPSKEDTNITERLKEAGEIIGIGLLDHVIITKNDYISYAEKGLLTS